MNYKLEITNFNLKLKGYTLIEATLYIALTAIIIGVISSMVAVTQQVSARNFVITEVEQTGNLLDLYITQTIRTATAVNSPASGASAAQISLNTSTPALNPTIFRLTGNNLVIAEASNPEVILNPSSIQITNLLFENASRVGTNASIKFSYTVTFINTNGRSENNYSRIFYGAANLR